MISQILYPNKPRKVFINGKGPQLALRPSASFSLPPLGRGGGGADNRHGHSRWRPAVVPLATADKRRRLRGRRIGRRLVHHLGRRRGLRRGLELDVLLLLGLLCDDLLGDGLDGLLRRRGQALEDIGDLSQVGLSHLESDRLDIDGGGHLPQHIRIDRGV